MATLNDVARCVLYIDDKNDGAGINNIPLQNLMFYAQWYYLTKYDKPLFDGTIASWVLGPTNAESYQRYKSFNDTVIPPPIDFDESIISKNEYIVINMIYDEYGDCYDELLRAMVYDESLWSVHSFDASIISMGEMVSHFKKIST